VLYKEIPFLRIVLPLGAGIAAGLFVRIPGPVVLTGILLFACGLMSFSCLNRRPGNIFFGILFSIALFSAGIVLYNQEKDRLSELPPGKLTLVCTLSEYPLEKTNSLELSLKMESIKDPEPEEVLRGNLLLYTRKEDRIRELLPGDRLLVTCTPEQIRNLGNPSEFDYRFYMENHGFRYSSFTDPANISIIAIPEHRKLVHSSLLVRERIIKMYEERGIKGERLTLVAAMTLGKKTTLDKEQKENFIKAGVMHIMAVSGLHAVILSFFILNVLFFLKKRFNILRILMALALLWIFAFVTGLTPSVLRAVIMFTFLQAGSLLKRRVNSINSVLASAFVLMLARPSVIFDAGFLLSYSAVLFIICFYNDLNTSVKIKSRLIRPVWQSAAVTTVAQAGTLPLTISLFNRFPLIFLLTNIIIVPLSSLLIIIGCLVPLTYPLVPVSTFFASMLGHITAITEFLTTKAASLSWASVDNIGMTGIESALLFVFLFTFLWFLLKKESISAVVPLITLLLFIISFSIKTIYIKSGKEFIVYKTFDSSQPAVREGKRLYFGAADGDDTSQILRHSATMGLNMKRLPDSQASWFIDSGNEKVIITGTLTNKIINEYNPDYVFLNGNNPGVEEPDTQDTKIRCLVISSEVSSAFKLPAGYLKGFADSVHYMARSGGFRTRL
jgi:competence protein ComEC